MICYFSGTGNSQRAAKQIARICQDQVFSINNSLKKGPGQTLHSDSSFVFVVPTYAWRIPRVVEQWIRDTTFTGSKSAYFVLTCGSDFGNAARYANSLCQEKGFSFWGLSGVVMPENYVAMFPTPDQTEAARILAEAEPHISQLADYIKGGLPLPAPPIKLLDKLKSGPVTPLFYSLFVRDKGFTVTEDCVDCGLCARRCPLGNITMENKKPVWHGNCTHCMACIGGCPTEAIEYKGTSKGRPRYYIMEDEEHG